MAPGAEVADCRTKPPTVCGESTQSVASGSWTKSETTDRGPEPAATGLDLLLPARREQKGAGRARRLDPTQAADAVVAALETQPYTSAKPAAGGVQRCAGVAVGQQRAWPVVERWRAAHARGLSKVLVRPHGLGFAARYSATFPVGFMNRRMRHRMSGGVGGRRG